MKHGDMVYITTKVMSNTTKGKPYQVEVLHHCGDIEIYDDSNELSLYLVGEFEPINKKTRLEELWERLRIMNRSLEEDVQQNTTDYHLSDNMEETERLYREFVDLLAKQELMGEIMEIVEGMMENE